MAISDHLLKTSLISSPLGNKKMPKTSCSQTEDLSVFQLLIFVSSGCI